ncbi:unnamed protein product, partial [Darwinula stevensoni]
ISVGKRSLWISDVVREFFLCPSDEHAMNESVVSRKGKLRKLRMEMKRCDVQVSGASECAGCGKQITDRYLLKALDMYWHEDCLKCGCCDCRLGEVGSTFFTKANLFLCKRDYLRLFGATGFCSACQKVIPAFEMVMRARSNVYHLECFACQQCNHRFCVGDRFYLWDNKILCEYDYEERLVFSQIPSCNNGNPFKPPCNISTGSPRFQSYQVCWSFSQFTSLRD